MQAGQRIFLAGHPRPDFNQEYVITAVDHQRTAKEYRNTFRCLPVQIVFRPLPVTPQPIVSGVVSGIVVGPPGETKHVDQFGRVRIRFPWRSPAHTTQTDPGDSGFVRVSQIATGVGSTALWLPDVGDEVAIAFEYGDPGRPVIIGSLYNGKDLPPVPLPANKHLSILRTQAANGQKTETVYDATVGSERLVLQSGSQILTLGTNGITVQGSSLNLAAGTVSVQAQTQLSLAAGAVLHVQAGTDLVEQVGRNLIVEVEKGMLFKAAQNFTLTSQRNAQFTVGDDAVIVTGKSLVTQSGTLFKFVAAQTGTLQVGDGLLAIRRDGNIDILGKDIAVTSGGNLTLKSSKDLTFKGSKITQN